MKLYPEYNKVFLFLNYVFHVAWPRFLWTRTGSGYAVQNVASPYIPPELLVEIIVVVAVLIFLFVVVMLLCCFVAYKKKFFKSILKRIKTTLRKCGHHNEIKTARVQLSRQPSYDPVLTESVV